VGFIRREIDLMTEIGQVATSFMIKEFKVHCCFCGGVPLAEL
jgi:hypothetical protein